MFYSVDRSLMKLTLLQHPSIDSFLYFHLNILIQLNLNLNTKSLSIYADFVWRSTLKSLLQTLWSSLWTRRLLRCIHRSMLSVNDGVRVAHLLFYLYVLFCLFYVPCCVCLFSMSGLCPLNTFFWFPLESWFSWLLLYL